MMLDQHTQPITPFFNAHAEEALLGAILIDGKPVMARVSAIVGAGDFYYPRNGYIYEAMQACDDIDFVTVADKLTAMGNFADSGGHEYLTHLMTQFVSSANIEAYANTVKGYSIRRVIFETARGVMQGLTQDTDTDPTTQLQGFISSLQKIKLPAMSQDFKSIMQGYLDEKESLWNDPTLRAGLSWGIPAMDIAFGEPKPQQLILIAGSAGAGKSLILAHVINRWLAQNVRIGLLTLEMANSEVLDRLAEIRCGVNFDNLLERRRELTANKKLSDTQKESELAKIDMEYKRLMHAWSQLYKLPFHTSDEPCSIDLIESRLYEWEQEAGEMPRVLVVDYAGLLEASTSQNGYAKDYEKLSYISATLKRIAKKHKIIVLSAVQLNREGYGTNAPTMKEIGGSIGFARDADKIIGVYRPNADDTSLLNLNSMKYRSGAGGGVVRLRQNGLNLMVLTEREER